MGNALAYYNAEIITAEKSFMVTVLGLSDSNWKLEVAVKFNVAAPRPPLRGGAGLLKTPFLLKMNYFFD